jgi:uncharacterized protein
MHPSIAKHKDEIIALCKKHGILKLEIFGSAARGVDFDEERSDVDLIARFDYGKHRQSLATFFNFSDDLEKIVGRKVDLSEDVPIKNPYLKRSIDASRELIYAA